MLADNPGLLGRWSIEVRGVEKGTLKVTYWATDRAGNTAADQVRTVQITK